MLTDVPEINQEHYMDLVRFSIHSGTNILVLGPSGGGKTIMAKQIAEQENAQLIYINLAVLERPDFQGLPVLSGDKRFVSYATPEFLPFADSSVEEAHVAISNLLNTLSDDDPVRPAVELELAKVNQQRKAKAIEKAIPYLAGKNDKLDAMLEKALDEQANDTSRPIVFLFDEVDKAATDTTQTLLELLQMHTINGRPLNVRSCILTGNLPDEHAHTNNISHAITKRCQTYKLNIEFKLWKRWAFNSNLNELVLGFLVGHEDYLYKKAPDGDPTAYALPSPRTWEMAATALDVVKNNPTYKNMDDDEVTRLQKHIVAGCVGGKAATEFTNWLKYFRKIDPYVKKLMETGEFPPQTLGAQEKIVCGISAVQKLRSMLKPGEKRDKLKNITQNIFKWLDTLSIDNQIAAVRLGFGSEPKICFQYGLTDVPEFTKIFHEIKKALGDWGADASKKGRK